MLAAGILVASVGAMCTVPLAAQATATGKCIWYDADIPPASGTPKKPLQDCGLHSEQREEASYYWSDEARVITEPRKMAFDYSAYGGLDPFSTEYSLRKANELFPDTSTATAAYDKLAYAENALGTKARTLESRKGVTTADGCTVKPALWTDYQIRNEGGWLPAEPSPDGETGAYTYSIGSDLSGEQKAILIDALMQFDHAREGTLLPRFIEWQTGSDKPPTVTFQSGDLSPSAGEPAAMTTYDHWDFGREHLRRWIDGHVAISPEIEYLSSLAIVHEILHVYGYAHLAHSVPGATMSAFTDAVNASRAAWMMDTEPPPPGVQAVDKCTRQALTEAKSY